MDIVLPAVREPAVADAGKRGFRTRYSDARARHVLAVTRRPSLSNSAEVEAGEAVENQRAGAMRNPRRMARGRPRVPLRRVDGHAHPERDTHPVAELNTATDTKDHLDPHHATGSSRGW